jgi:hypothetical protein
VLYTYMEGAQKWLSTFRARMVRGAARARVPAS